MSDDVDEARRLIRAANALRRRRRELEQMRSDELAADRSEWQIAVEEFKIALNEFRRR